MFLCLSLFLVDWCSRFRGKLLTVAASVSAKALDPGERVPETVPAQAMQVALRSAREFSLRVRPTVAALPRRRRRTAANTPPCRKPAAGIVSWISDVMESWFRFRGLAALKLQFVRHPISRRFLYPHRVCQRTLASFH